TRCSAPSNAVRASNILKRSDSERMGASFRFSDGFADSDRERRDHRCLEDRSGSHAHQAGPTRRRAPCGHRGVERRAIVSKDVNGIVTSWNAAAERMFGYSASEMVGQSIRTIIPDDRQHEE